MESRLSAELGKLMGQAACVGGKHSRRKHLDKRKNIQRVTNGHMRPEREQKQESGKKKSTGRKRKAHKMYVFMYTYISLIESTQ